jgi:hypothetical protein
VSPNERPARHRLSPLWPARLALFCAIVASIAARTLLAPYLINWASRLTHGSATWMFTAGWATAGFVPAAALIFLLDGNRRERQLGHDPLKRAHLAHGHAIAGRGKGYWIRRLPLIVALLVAVVFAPSRTGGSPVDWDATPGGDSFRQGWHLSFLISLPALIALLVFRLLALLPGHGDRLLRVAGSLTAATPVLALLGLYTSTH